MHDNGHDNRLDIEQRAFQGDAAAQCAVGDEYFFAAFDAEPDDKDDLYKKSLYWYQRAAHAGSAAGAYDLGY